MAETACGVIHLSIGDAIQHAEDGLGFPQRWHLHKRRLHVGAEYCFGTMSHNSGSVIGRQMGPRLRWRLDYDPKKGTHVNDEHRTLNRRVYHPIADHSALLVYTLWRKWTTQTSPIDLVIQNASYRYLRDRRSNPALTIEEVCSRIDGHDAAMLAKAVRAYIKHYDYLEGSF